MLKSMESQQRWFMIPPYRKQGGHHSGLNVAFFQAFLQDLLGTVYVISESVENRNQTYCRALLRREVVQQFMDFVDSHCSSEDIVPVLIAHNGKSFDIPFLALEFAREGFQIPPNWHFLDTLLVARRVINKEDISSMRLVRCFAWLT